MGWSISDIVGSGVGAAVGSIVTPVTNAWVKTKESAAESHKIDKQTDQAITIESFRTDAQFAQAQRLLAEADKTHWSTRWIRPAFSALSFGWMVGLLAGYDPALPPEVKYLLVGIPGAIFLLRPYEKGKRTEIAAQAQVPVSPLRKLIGGRDDSRGT